MALAWVTSRPFVTSNIIGATSIEQLSHDLDSVSMTLTDAMIEDIEALHAEMPNPCP